MFTKTSVIVLLSSILFVSIQHIVRMIYFQGYHVTVFNQSPGPCHLLDHEGYGSEDIHTLPNGISFITVGVNNGDVHGLLKFDFNHPERGVKLLKIEKTNGNSFDEEEFRPHGLSILQENRKVYIYVVSHPRRGERVEKFEYEPKKDVLVHLNTFSEKGMREVNDIAVVTQDKFYYTNSLYNRQYIFLERWLLLPTGDVRYFDGKNSKAMESSLLMPNGLVLSPDKKILHVPISGTNEIRSYKIGDSSNLTLTQTFKVNEHLDNLDVDEKGRLWTGSHPSVALIFKHQSNIKTINSVEAPSRVFMFNVKDNRILDMQQMYADNGTVLRGSSAASFWKNKLLIGTVTHKLMYCEISHDLP